DAIAAARGAQREETERVYSVEYSGADFVPEIDDHLDREQVFDEFIAQTGSAMTQSRVLGVLNRELPGDLQRVWHNRGEHGYHVEYGYSCMGYEVNAALGVKLAEPQREVYAMVGDGAFMMLHSELVTSIQEGCKINVVLFDNMTNGCINNLQMEHGMDSYTTEFRFRNPQGGKLDGKLVPVDFAMLAAAYGCKTYRVTTEQQLLDALADARRQTVSTLLDIKVLPKTMVHKYLSWWRVGGAQVADSEKIVAVARKLQENIDKARDY
ncbi:thiamine pyrophosphate-dependent enzyme, partial [Serratia marcescens]|uniref:thiamine pyrophosphate-dependent enzyme n=1 Tax=Serratia marcescens TaxID=615 RepID=UPI000FA175BC